MNFNKLSAEELRWMTNNRCKHGHKYSSHPNCYLKEKNIKEKVGFLDIEFYAGRNRWGKIAADWGYMLCWCIGDEKGKIKYDVVTPEEMRTIQDKRIVKTLIQEMENYDRICGHYSDGCDLPFARTRAALHEIPFPAYKEIVSTDVWKIAKSKFTLSSNSQRTLSILLRGFSEKTEVNAQTWLAAARGDKKALNKVLAHCKVDIKELTMNYYAIIKYSPKSNRSI